MTHIAFRRDIMQSTVISTNAKLVLSSILYINKANNGFIEVSYKYFADTYGLTLDEVGRCFEEMEANDFISTKLVREGRVGDIYKVTVHPLVNCYFPNAVPER